MYCNECGKPNPDYAKFCAFCGEKLLEPEGEAKAPEPMPESVSESVPESAPPIVVPDPEPVPVQKPVERPATVPQKPIPLKPDVIKSDPHQVFRRPLDSETVRPLLDNPAQPSRTPKPVAPEMDVDDDIEKSRPAAPPPKPASGPVTATGNRVPPPARPQNVKKPGHYQGISHRPPAPSPYKQAQEKRAQRNPDDDLFFEDIAPDDIYEAEEDDNFARHLKAIIATLFVLAVLCVLGWLFLTGDGQVFRAGLGMDASAGAYRVLGDRAMEQGHIQRASAAYHEALKRDGSNFEYAMLVAQTAAQSGEVETAAKAYQLCMQLRPDSPEAYRQLAELLESRGNHELGEQWRRQGFDQSGDESLIEMFITPEPTPTPIPTPSVPQFSDIADDIPFEG